MSLVSIRFLPVRLGCQEKGLDFFQGLLTIALAPDAVFPYPQNAPAGSQQGFLAFLVPGHVALDFLHPVLAPLGCRQLVSFQVKIPAMPEFAVNEYRPLLARQGDVRTTLHPFVMLLKVDLAL